MKHWEDPRRVLKRYGLTPKRSFSQNFLASQAVHAAIVEAVGARTEHTLVELGAGLGTLTNALLAGQARVVAVERDRDMLHVLSREFGDEPRLLLRQGDAASLDFGALAAEFDTRVCVVGNLPYAISGAIFRNLVGAARHLSRAVVMVQREVRDRLVALPGTHSYAALTVFVSAAFEVRTVRLVPASAFHPPPKVNSALVCLEPYAQPRARESAAFQAVVRAAFQARRKTLRNALAQLAGDRRAVEGALRKAGLSGDRRGETLSVEHFAQLAEAWADAGLSGA